MIFTYSACCLLNFTSLHLSLKKSFFSQIFFARFWWGIYSEIYYFYLLILFIPYVFASNLWHLGRIKCCKIFDALSFRILESSKIYSCYYLFFFAELKQRYENCPCHFRCKEYYLTYILKKSMRSSSETVK